MYIVNIHIAQKRPADFQIEKTVSNPAAKVSSSKASVGKSPTLCNVSPGSDCQRPNGMLEAFTRASQGLFMGKECLRAPMFLSKIGFRKRKSNTFTSPSEQNQFFPRCICSCQGPLVCVIFYIGKGKHEQFLVDIPKQLTKEWTSIPKPTYQGGQVLQFPSPTNEISK